MLKEIPGDVLSEIVSQNGDWLLYYLKINTLFDVDRIGFVMTLGRRAAQEELERRQREADEQSGATAVETAVDADPFDLSSLLGGVVDVSMEGSTPDESFEETPIPEYPAGTERATFEITKPADQPIEFDDNEPF